MFFFPFLQDAITHTKLGQIYETFGPTTQPFYQIKFNAAFALDPERVRVGREVFHVPTRSRFVFVNQIKAFKGSDASNVHDEEPAEDELEFSDDEAEAAYRSRRKRKCVSTFLFFTYISQSSIYRTDEANPVRAPSLPRANPPPIQP